MASLLAGCRAKAANPVAGGGAAPGTATGPVKRGGTLNAISSLALAEDFEPYGTTSQQVDLQVLLTLIYSGLLRLKVGERLSYTDSTMEGALASTWEQPDPQTLVFRLRPGVTFHNKPPVNGRELTVADVKFSYDRLFASSFPYINFFSSISSIETPDAQTVTMKLKAPDAALLLHIATGFAWVLAKEAGAHDSNGALGLSFHDPSSAIGTGPFILDAYQHDVKASFVGNPSYFETGLPYLDRIEYVVLTDPAAQVAALQTGQAMLGYIPAGGETGFKSRNPKLVYAQSPSNYAWHYGMRVDQKPFNDVRVRRAFAMSYDQNAVKAIWGYPNTPSSYGSLTAITGDAFLPLEKLGDAAQYWKLDPQAAKQLLAAAGYPSGFEVDANTSNCCGPELLEDQLVASLAKAGIKVNLRIKEHAAYLATTGRGNYVGIAGNQVPVWDPNDWFSLTMLANSPRDISHVDDPTANDLAAKQRSELDPKKRLDVLHQLVQHCASQCFYVVEPQAQDTEVRQPFIKNYSPRFGYQPSLMVAWLDK
jgi:peptide/nickel transport system substrate-binding protein